MNVTDTESGLQAALDADPPNPLLRLVLADHLEERGDERAAGYRALGELNRVPRRSKWVDDAGIWSFVWDHNVWAWAGAFMGDGDLQPFALADGWIREMEDATVVIGGNYEMGWRRMRTRREIEDSAARAFARLPQEQRDAILKAVPV